MRLIPECQYCGARSVVHLHKTGQRRYACVNPTACFGRVRAQRDAARRERDDALAEAILKRIVEICNSDTLGSIAFVADLGGNSLRLRAGLDHVHVGYPDQPWPEFVRELHDLLVVRRFPDAE